MSAPTAPRPTRTARTVRLEPGDVVVRATDLPAPGEVRVVLLGEQLTAVVENTGDELVADGAPVDAVVRYVPVEVSGARVVHAAAVRQRAVRTRVDSVALCSRGVARRVNRRLDEAPLELVSCRQCRGHLARAGAVDDPIV